MLAQGTLLRNGAYRVESHLATGGFGNTYKVRNVAFDEVYALKEFFMRGVNLRSGNMVTVSVPDNRDSYESQKEKFKKEALRLRRLNNPHIVRVHDLFEENGTAYYVMDYIDGSSVGAMLKERSEGMTEAEVNTILPQILDALKTVHNQQIWHLDIKPGNIMLNRQGQAYLIDFGASKQMRSDGGMTSSALCYTPGFAPMEQVEQDIEKFGPWTDFYALGATIYYMLTKQVPPSSAEIMEGGGFVFPATVSPKMQKLIRWMMEPQRKQRPQSVNEIDQFLADNSASAPVAAPMGAPVGIPVGVPLAGANGASTDSIRTFDTSDADDGTQLSQSLEKPRRSFPWKIVAAVVVVLLLGGAAWFFFAKSSDMKKAENEKEDYLEMVEKCEQTISNADSYTELSPVDGLLKQIVGIEDDYAHLMPEVYDASDGLKKQYSKKLQSLREEYVELAEDNIDENNYRAAYDLLNEAHEALPDDDDLKDRVDKLAADMGYLYINNVNIYNGQDKANDLESAFDDGELHSDELRYLWPVVSYNSLQEDGASNLRLELMCDFVKPNGYPDRSESSPDGHTYSTSLTLSPGSYHSETFLGWGNETKSNFPAGSYRYEVFYHEHKIFSHDFEVVE